MPDFIPGLELGRRFYHEAVRPILVAHFPSLPHAAGNIGSGSEVLGFDTQMSRDHEWGPRFSLFVQEEDSHRAAEISGVLSQHLPSSLYGYPVNFKEHSDEPGIASMDATTEGPLNHRVFCLTLRTFFQDYLGYDINQPLEAADWLTFPSQKLRTITAGAVYHDGPGELTALRQRLAYYPHDIWLYLLAAGWTRIGQEEHLMPRAGYVGDELGSAIIGSRLVRDIMSLGFLMEKQYPPYQKWFGTAFGQLKCAAGLSPVLWRVQQSERWQEREAALVEAYEYLARAHNALAITEKLPQTVSNFHNRPFRVISGATFAEAIRAQITDLPVKRLAAARLIGSLDQFSDSTDLHEDTALRPILRKLYADDD